MSGDLLIILLFVSEKHEIREKQKKELACLQILYFRQARVIKYKPRKRRKEK